MFDFDIFQRGKERQFRETQYYLTFPKTEAMTISKGTKEFAAGLYEHVFGYDPAIALEEERKQYKELLEKERIKAEAERIRAEEERQRTILYLHDTLQMPPAEIAEVLNLDPTYVKALLEAPTDKNEE
jgi:DNA-directed RNA polymerase specialized sigma24 family protein